jgi:hypothetical protein
MVTKEPVTQEQKLDPHELITGAAGLRPRWFYANLAKMEGEKDNFFRAAARRRIEEGKDRYITKRAKQRGVLD